MKRLEVKNKIARVFREAGIVPIISVTRGMTGIKIAGYNKELFIEGDHVSWLIGNDMTEDYRYEYINWDELGAKFELTADQLERIVTIARTENI